MGVIREKPFQSKKEIEEYLIGEKVQCLECGKYYISVGTHCIKAHGMLFDDYKLKWGIPLIVGVIPAWRREDIRIVTLERVAAGTFGDISIPLNHPNATKEKRSKQRDKPEWHKALFTEGGRKRREEVKLKDSVFEEFCRRIAMGRSCADVQKDEDMTSMSNLYKRSLTNPEIRKAIKDAMDAKKTAKTESNRKKSEQMLELRAQGVTKGSIKKKLRVSSDMMIEVFGSTRKIVKIDPADRKLKCDECGIMYLSTPAQWIHRSTPERPRASYCSDECSVSGKRKKQLEIARAKGQTIVNLGTMLVGPCPQCGEMYPAKYTARKYCSGKCYHASPEFKERLKINGEKGNLATIAKFTDFDHPRKNCPVCNTEFQYKNRINTNIPEQIYCSTACRDTARRQAKP